ncbi:transcription initiation factor TFIID [Paenibacillus sp. FSL H8-0548]|uniref:transcription initiation factor TFIID n=1 Tax=Paenibacillus sp. FSL H8-0548 TaxID=1920422 RepID=UPI00096E3F26|nr:transcription initiation factor TFIID [Paenibacillus sp. FSL H8-0548]OMF36933.1 transcription initiation factor TFIID [Paenibacillus sp. FSL H8-0548]
MRIVLDQYAADYSAAEQKLSGLEDDQSSIYYPTVFLFIGDEAEEAIAPMIRSNEQRWDNNAGVVYFHVCTGETAAALAKEDEGKRIKSSQKVMRVSLAGVTAGQGDSRTKRKDIGAAFHEEGSHLVQLNRALRQVSDRIADYGRLYASFDRLQLAVITRVDDPLNVLVPEISLLAKSIFLLLFKSVQMDMYALIQEREQAETFGYGSAAGISFLRELDGMQRPDYSYSAQLQVTGDGLAIPVIHNSSPLFDLVYVLSDRNERGMTTQNGMLDNYEIICHILLLKNRKRKDAQLQSNEVSYNNSSFKNSLMAESGRQGFVSAGLAKVKRPNYSIALTVLYHFFKQLKLRLQSSPELGSKEKLAFFGLDAPAMEARLAGIVPSEEQLVDMQGLLTSGIKFEQIRRMSLREAEEALFSDSCATFFHKHFTSAAEERMGAVKAAEELQRTVSQRLKEHPEISFYQVAEWSGEQQESGSTVEAVRARMRDLVREIDLAGEELERTREMRVEDLKFKRLPLLDKQNLRSFIRVFLDTVYQLKWHLLRLETELAMYRRFAGELNRLHETYQASVEQMAGLEHELKETALQSIRVADEYIGQNIFDYYERVTENVMKEFEEKRGTAAFFENALASSVRQLLEQGDIPFVERLISICRKHILTAEPFAQTFEEELLLRANVSIAYSNRKALSRDELFHKLYRMLEENAVIHTRLLDYTHEHRYEEKYLFGDRESEFIRYALGVDETSRIYKLGCVHEKRSSGVEKLNLMGGFHLDDLMYYRNGKVYYETYMQNGYEFHALDPSLLPKLR